jgi:hypothetical protein
MSLRARLLVGMIGSFALLLVAFGLVIGASIEYSFVREFDFYLETVARTLAAAAEVHDRRVEVKLVPESLPDIEQVEGELFSQYWRDDGTVVARSTNLAEQSLPCFSGDDGRGARRCSPSFSPTAEGRGPRGCGFRSITARGRPMACPQSPAAPRSTSRWLSPATRATWSRTCDSFDGYCLRPERGR